MLSTQQAAFCNWVETGEGSALLRARAGTGKTFSLIEALKRALMVATSRQVRITIALCAYNNKIAKEIDEKVTKAGLPAVVGTFHKFGYAAWRQACPGVRLEGTGKGKAGYFKFDRIADILDIPHNIRGFVRKAASLAKQRAFGVLCGFADAAEWMNLVQHFDLEDTLYSDPKDRDRVTPEEHEALLREALNFSCRALKEAIRLGHEIIDFDEMLWLPLVGNVRFVQYDWVLVDEAQDTNPARRELAKRMLKPSGRAVFVGDDRQAIYGFTGADNDSLEIIKNEFQCEEFPLTVTYRCPKAVVAVAQALVSDYEAHPDAPEGSYSRINEDSFSAMTFNVANDMILCRNTKPLVDVAFTLIRRGIPCHVEGKEIGAGLIRLVTRFNGVSNLSILEDRLEEHRSKETEKLMSQNKEAQADGLNDRIDTVIAIIRGMPRDASTSDLKAKIDGMFADTPEGKRPDSVTLMTGHRSKGLERKRVFVLGANKYCPSKFARQPHQIAQETNLLYVMITRAQDTLIEVDVL